MVTIICLSYNHEKYIGQTLENFVNQKTNFKIQVIVHDDASKDRSAEIIRQYAEKYPDIIIPVLQEVNQYSILPAGEVYKKHINPLIKGKYIATCEGDDYWCDDTKLQKQVDFMEDHPEYSLCVHNSYFLDMTTEEKKVFNDKVKNDCDIKFEDIADGLMGIFHLSSWLYRKELHFNFPSFCTAVPSIGDYPKALFFAGSGKIHFINEIMSVYRYRSTPTSWTSKNNSKRNNYKDKKEYVDKRVMMLELVKKEYPENTEVINKAIKRKKFELVKITGNYKELKEDPFYKELYDKLGFKDKIKFLIRHFSRGKI